MSERHVGVGDEARCPLHGTSPECRCYAPALDELPPLTAAAPTPRFRVEFTNVGDEASGDRWEAKVWDLADHGPDITYAEVMASRLVTVLRHVSPYLLAAEEEPTTLTPVEERGGSVSPL